MSRLIFSAIIAVLTLAVVELAEAQQPAKVYRIGYLWFSPPEQGQSRLTAFQLGLGDLGYVLGKNLLIESRWADGKSDRLADLAADLVRLNVDVIVTGVNSAVVAAKQATSTIPIVMTSGNDPIGSGLVASLARPGGNVTGLSMDTGEKNFGKRLELTKESSGNDLSRVAVLFNGASTAHQLYLKNLDQPARSLKLTLIPVEYREAGDFENAFKTMTTKHAGGMFLFSDGVSAAQRAVIASLAAKNRLPSSYPERSYVEAGGLLSYGPDLNNNMRRAATYVDKIFKGAKPAELPIEQPTKFEFVINLKTAKQIGLTIPPDVLARADKVIR
jgi:putative tryptophan/tyrosine transport system substrate-binding protein